MFDIERFLHRLYKFLDDDRNSAVVAQVLLAIAFVVIFVGVTYCALF